MIDGWIDVSTYGVNQDQNHIFLLMEWNGTWKFFISFNVGTPHKQIFFQGSYTFHPLGEKKFC